MRRGQGIDHSARLRIRRGEIKPDKPLFFSPRSVYLLSEERIFS
jgi:hypothetical protein